jgi:hypothetical protein
MDFLQVVLDKQMLKWIFFVSALLFASSINAQESLRQIEGPQPDIFEKILEAGETDIELVGIFENDDVQIVFTVNRNLETKTFTITETSIFGTSCIIGSGMFEGNVEPKGPKL